MRLNFVDLFAKQNMRIENELLFSLTRQMSNTIKKKNLTIKWTRAYVKICNAVLATQVIGNPLLMRFDT